MNKTKLLGLAILTVLVCSFLFGLAIKSVSASTLIFTEYQVTSNSAQQENPDLYYYSWSDYIFVWQDNRNGNWDIYAYAPFLNAWTPEIRITSDSANQVNPKVYGDWIVYQDDRNGNWDIYAYNISSKVETQITGDPKDQVLPAIDNNRIAWQDARNGYWIYDYYGRPEVYRNWDIYMYDSNTQTESRITISNTNLNPAISGNRIAYTKLIKEYTFTFPYLYYYNLLTGAEVQVINGYDFGGSESTTISSVAISDSSIVWQYYYQPFMEWDTWNDEVGLVDASNGATWSSAGYGIINQRNPDIAVCDYDKYMVFEDTKNGNSDIYIYKANVQTTHRVTNNPATQSKPAIFSETGKANTIIYMDNRNGNWDIYYTSFGYIVQGGDGGSDNTIYDSGTAESTYDSPSEVTKTLQTLKTTIADMPVDSFDGANAKVKENRRNAILNQIDFAISSLQTAAGTQDLTIRRIECQNAINQLSDLGSKTDGSFLRGSFDAKGSGYTPDWIITSQGQRATFNRINAGLMILESLLENIGNY